MTKLCRMCQEYKPDTYCFGEEGRATGGDRCWECAIKDMHWQEWVFTGFNPFSYKAANAYSYLLKIEFNPKYITPTSSY